MGDEVYQTGRGPCITFLYLLLLYSLLLLLVGCARDSQVKDGHEWHDLALLELQEGQGNLSACRRALHFIDRALLYQQRSEYCLLKANLLLVLGDLAQSSEWYERARVNAQGGLRFELANNYACCLAAQGQEREAEALWNGLIAEPMYATPEVAWFNKARIALLRKHYGSARQSLEQALACQPLYIDARYYLAGLLFEQGFISEAAKHVALLCQQDPNHAGAKQLKEHLVIKG